MGKKLFQVMCRGMQSNLHATSYVVADDPTSAYERVKHALETRGLGTPEDREMESVILIAEQADYPTCGVVLYA